MMPAVVNVQDKHAARAQNPIGVFEHPPTILGTVISAHALTPYLSLACYTLAAGSLLYVIMTLAKCSYKGLHRTQAAIGVALSSMVAMRISGVVSRPQLTMSSICLVECGLFAICRQKNCTKSG